ncbi:MAG: hypothetical protein CVV42_18845 [Candidatus Riflebacteria bacterium HGW-Riflebacteria-2]|jgi:hypothetical protein|nr:MAG: hypothetical protein CVV42_18845 [Candidatus Riflebacteria bacterium HGW-Riflebacteria-2]
MKKLFVLFLLISLVPFSLGCFGGGSDDTVVSPESLELTVDGLDKASLRAFTYADWTVELAFGSYKVVLTAKEAVSGNANAAVFYKLLANDSELAVRNALLEAGNKITASLYKKGSVAPDKSAVFFSSASVAKMEIAITATGVTVSINDLDVAGGIEVVLAANAVTSGGVALVTDATADPTELTPVNNEVVINVNPNTALADADVTAAKNNGTYDVKVNGVAVPAARFAPTLKDDGSIDLTVDTTGLVAGTKYTVVIYYIQVGEKILTSESTYYFTVK